MTYIESSLAPGEKLVFSTKLQLGIFIQPIAGFAFSLVCMGFGVLIAMMLGGLTGGASVLMLLIVGFIVGIAFLSVLYRLVYLVLIFFTNEYGVTNRRVIAKTGVIRQHSTEIMLKQVEGIHVDQGIFGRIGDYGNIMIMGAGGTKEMLTDISAPLAFRNAINEQLHKKKGKEEKE